MSSNLRVATVLRSTLAVMVASGVLLAFAQPSNATPIFAERYGFSCSACHTAVPELNAFGNAFRRAGFVLPSVPRHKEFPLVLRFQEGYMKDLPPAQTRRFNALAILISTANFGSDRSFSYYARYFFGSQGASGSLYYGWLQHVAAGSGVFERVGEYNLPLIQNATQRLDTFTSMPAYTYTVGQNSANFTTPRWGAMFGQDNGRLNAEVSLNFAEYLGAAYGAPTPPSNVTQLIAFPEIFASATYTLADNISFGALRLAGTRNFHSDLSGESFSDRYYRDGIQAGWSNRHFSIDGQQLWGFDTNADGLGTGTASSGGFVTAKYYPTPHAYLGVRYDAAANPFATRDWDFYGAFAPTVRSRLLLEYIRPINRPGAQTQLNAQLLFALPPANWVH
ncbi:MAG: hypothetical protein JOZ91_09530 [Candidatus Eremiobacteraeota bacterium]|nr:hypothetical protein [Candidatus Eremiobacteraeota bacterium]